MAKSKTKKSVMQGISDYRLRRMIFSRLFGIGLCIACIVCLVAYYKEIFNEWLVMIILSFCMGTLFSLNSFIQDIKVGNPWQRVNGIVSVMFYLLVGFLIVYGFVSGELQLQF